MLVYLNIWWVRLTLFSIFYLPIYLLFTEKISILEDFKIPYSILYFFFISSGFLVTVLIDGKRYNSKWYYSGFWNDKLSKRSWFYIFLVITISFLILFFFFFFNSNKILAFHKISSGYLIDSIFYLLAFSFSEELIFRGIPFQSLIGKWDIITVGLMSNILFTFVHITNPSIGVISIINIFMAGILFTLIFIKTKSLIACTLSHFLWNFYQVFLLGLPLSGFNFKIGLFEFEQINLPETITGGDFGIEGSILTTFIIIIQVLLFFKYLKYNPFVESRLLLRDYSI